MTASYFMSNLVADNLSARVDIEWTDAVLYTPYHIQQALLYEHADCLAVRAFLKMVELPFRLEERPNAEFMSPSGKVPFLRLQTCLIPEFLPLVEFVARRGVKLSAGLTDAQRADMQAHMALFDQVLKNVEVRLAFDSTKFACIYLNFI
ncbi:unnamed protein product [Gongylonema pulchrum]|uniref:Thioredoxin-like_fold domain-containing protein n=1 Tax=Gongylonema pulchrum TaxID=637853 RepID=A0A183EF25_9BILA|nr:unnamed protein product [Gongylonema pulchrum]